MARFVDPGRSREHIDQVVAAWVENCLLADGSLLFGPERPIWSLAHVVDFRERFLTRAIFGTDQNFEEKLAEQLEDADPDVRWLAAELLAVHFLFAYVAIGPEAKIAIVKEAAGSAWESEPPGWGAVAAALEEGIGNPGSGFNIRRDLQLSYLLDFTERWKALPAEDQQAKLDDPWALRDFADEANEGVAVREMRHILLHLLRPDEFERISSGTHKRQIVAAFRAEFLAGEEVEDLDEQLLAIRRKLEELNPQPELGEGVVDFYYPPLHAIWDASAASDGEGAGDLDLLLYKRQLVFYGPPGTSKTHRTRALAETLIRREALQRWGAKRFFEEQELLDTAARENVRWVQLHPGYGYEEFVRGLRLEGEGTVYAQGLLMRLVEEMEARDEETALPIVLVLDEINRTDLSRMFGEVFSLLENRDAVALLPGINPGEVAVELRLPGDLYLIGTMNLIDQSVEQLDFAMRRRFFWRACEFEREPIVEVNRARWEGFAPSRYGWERAEHDVERLADRAQELNREIADSNHLGAQYALGHTYFFDAAYLAGSWLQGKKRLSGGPLWTSRGKPQPPLLDLWSLSLEPILGQYLEGVDPATAREEMERLRGVLLAIETL